MKRPVRMTVSTACLVSLWFAPQALAVLSIATTGSWSKSVDANDLVAGAGTDLVSTQTSSSNQGSIDVSGTTGDSDNWRIDVKRVDTTWDSDFTIYVRRTGDGTGSGSISGGTTFQEVTTTDATFFSGSGDRSGINVEFKIEGFSVGTIPVDTYDTAITYTIVDTP